MAFLACDYDAKTQSTQAAEPATPSTIVERLAFAIVRQREQQSHVTSRRRRVGSGDTVVVASLPTMCRGNYRMREKQRKHAVV
ncbi:hypothetical protein ACLKA6_009789 [Drosophila palustris]